MHLGVCLWATGFIVNTDLLRQSGCQVERLLRVNRPRGNHLRRRKLSPLFMVSGKMKFTRICITEL